MSSVVALNTALGDIAVATRATQSQLTWIVDAYTLVLACLLLPAGAIGDRYGRRGALLAGVVVFGAASAAPLLIGDATALIVARAAAGAGAAFIMPATLSLITSAYPADQRTRAVGIWAGMAGCGGVIGMMGSGVLLHFSSWQAIFWAFATASAALLLATLAIGTSRDSESHPVDWPGGALIAVAMAALVLGILEAPMRGWGHPLVVGAIGAGIALAGAFVALELRRTHPLLDVRLFRDPHFSTGATAITMMFLAMFGFFFLVMQFVMLVLGYSPLAAAFALTPLVVPLVILSVLSGWYLPRLGLRAVVFGGLVLLAVGLLAMRHVDVGASYSALAWPLLLISAGVGFFTAPTTSAIMTAVPDAKQGVASAVNDTTRELGAALGIALAGSLLAGQYTGAIGPAVAGLPAPARDAASRSLAEALEVAARIGPGGDALGAAARQAFVTAMDSALLILAVFVACSAVAIALWAPGRNGKQFAFIARRRTPRPGAPS